MGCSSQIVPSSPSFNLTSGIGSLNFSAFAHSCSRGAFSYSGVGAGLEIGVPINLSLMPAHFRVQLSVATHASYGIVAGTCTPVGKNGSCFVASGFSDEGSLYVTDITTGKAAIVPTNPKANWYPAPANGSSDFSICSTSGCNVTMVGNASNSVFVRSILSLYMAWPVGFHPVRGDSYVLNVLVGAAIYAETQTNASLTGASARASVTLDVSLAQVSIT